MEKLSKISKLFNKIYYNIFVENFKGKLEYNFPSDYYRWDLIKYLINKYNYIDYLEIGCDQDENFSRIKIQNKIGVDPKSGGTHRMTSDVFFENNSNKFDLIFLDGLHTYEQTIKDIKNAIQCIQNEGVILVHDCLPKKIWNQIVPRIYGHWNGDVWKAIVEARTYNYIETFTCIADHGLGVILKKKNSKVLNTKIKDFKNLRFSDYYKHHKDFMNTITYEQLKKIIQN